MKVGGEGGIRTPVPVTRQDAFEAPPLRPLRYLSVIGARGFAARLGSLRYARSSLLAPLHSRFGASPRFAALARCSRLPSLQLISTLRLSLRWLTAAIRE